MKFEDLDFEEIVKYLFLGLTIFGVLFSLYYTFGHIAEPKMINFVMVLPFVFFLTPYLVLSLFQVKRIESKMQVIPRFLRDIVDNADSGMDLVSAITATVNNEYGVLNLDVRKFVNQLGWGVDFDSAMIRFAKNVGSRDLERDFLLIMEARRVGGHVDKILRELSSKILQENLRKSERKTNLASNTFTGYISFVIFVFIIVLVYNNLFLSLGSSMGSAQGGGTSIVGGETASTNDTKMLVYLSLLILLSYELAILSGFLFGLMSEGNVISGAPHVVALVVMTFLGFLIFIKW